MNVFDLSAIELLEYLQKNYITKSGNSPPVQHENYKDNTAFGEHINNLFEGKPDKENIINRMRFESENRRTVSLPTKYQDDLQYRELLDIYNLIMKEKEGVLDFFGITHLSSEKPTFGTVELDLISAEICCHNNEFLILVSSGVFHYAYRLSAILSMIFPFKERIDELQGVFSIDIDEVKNNFNNNPIIITLFCDLMVVTLFKENPAKSIAIQTNNAHSSMLAAQLYESFLSFVFSHEMAHFFHNHFSENKKLVKSLDDLDVNGFAQAMYNWNQEFEADSLGCAFTLATLQYNNSDPIKHMIGIISCVKSFEFFEGFQQIRNKEKVFSPTHPPSNMRVKFLLDRFFNEKTFVYESEFLNIIIGIFDFLWERFMVFYTAMEKRFDEKNERVLDQDFDYIQRLMLGLTKPDETSIV